MRSCSLATFTCTQNSAQLEEALTAQRSDADNALERLALAAKKLESTERALDEAKEAAAAAEAAGAEETEAREETTAAASALREEMMAALEHAEKESSELRHQVNFHPFILFSGGE